MQDTGVVSRLQGCIQDQYCGEHSQPGGRHEPGDYRAKPSPMEGNINVLITVISAAEFEPIHTCSSR